MPRTVPRRAVSVWLICATGFVQPAARSSSAQNRRSRKPRSSPSARRSTILTPLSGVSRIENRCIDSRTRGCERHDVLGAQLGRRRSVLQAPIPTHRTTHGLGQRPARPYAEHASALRDLEREPTRLVRSRVALLPNDIAAAERLLCERDDFADARRLVRLGAEVVGAREFG